MGASVQSISVADVSAREVDVRGVMRYCNVSFEKIVENVSNIDLLNIDISYCCRDVGFWES